MVDMHGRVRGVNAWSLELGGERAPAGEQLRRVAGLRPDGAKQSRHGTHARVLHPPQFSGMPAQHPLKDS